MASPFASGDHYPIAPGSCYCGQSFTHDANGDPVGADVATYKLDVHILGPQLAHQIHADRLAALAAIHAMADEMAGQGGAQ